MPGAGGGLAKSGALTTLACLPQMQRGLCRASNARPQPLPQRPLQERRDVPHDGAKAWWTMSAAAAWASGGRCALTPRDHACLASPCLNGGTCDLLTLTENTKCLCPRAEVR